MRGRQAWQLALASMTYCRMCLRRMCTRSLRCDNVLFGAFVCPALCQALAAGALQHAPLWAGVGSKTLALPNVLCSGERVQAALPARLSRTQCAHVCVHSLRLAILTILTVWLRQNAQPLSGTMPKSGSLLYCVSSALHYLHGKYTTHSTCWCIAALRFKAWGSRVLRGPLQVRIGWCVVPLSHAWLCLGANTMYDCCQTACACKWICMQGCGVWDAQHGVARLATRLFV
jgi:hypothetical protein